MTQLQFLPETTFTSSDSILRNNPSKTSSVEPKEKVLSPLPTLAEEMIAFPQFPSRVEVQQSRFSRTTRAPSRTLTSSPRHRNTFPLLPLRRNAGSTAISFQQQQQNPNPILPLSVYRTFDDFDSNYSFSIHPLDIVDGGKDGNLSTILRTPRMDEVAGRDGLKAPEFNSISSFPSRI